MFITAPLLVPRPIGGYLVDREGARVVPLARGLTLIANEARFRDHAFPDRWFEASFVVVDLSEYEARVSDARATNGAILRGAALPTATWRELDGADVTALEKGDGAQRIARLVPAWQPLHEGDALVATFPAATWYFTRSAPG